jgi:hypothetical protein
MTKEKNVYQIEIGNTNNRRGTFTLLNTIFCKSDESIENIRLHFNEKYSPFTVRVIEIEEFEKPEIISVEQKETERIKELKKEIQTLKQKVSTEVSFLTTEFYFKNFSEKVQKIYNEKSDLLDTLQDLNISIREEIKNEINQKYKYHAELYEFIDFPHFSERSYLTIKLKIKDGKLLNVFETK